MRSKEEDHMDFKKTQETSERVFVGMYLCIYPTRSEEYVACGGMPGDDAHAFGVSFQDHNGVGEGAG